MVPVISRESIMSSLIRVCNFLQVGSYDVQSQFIAGLLGPVIEQLRALEPVISNSEAFVKSIGLMSDKVKDTFSVQKKCVHYNGEILIMNFPVSCGT